MEFIPLSPVIGAQVNGVDLRDALSDEEQAQMRSAFARYHLLLLRDQEITVEDQERFSSYFGQPIRTHKTTDDGLMYVSNKIKDGAVPTGALPFHQDHSFFDVPDTDELMLYALEIPSSGGDTLWANTQKAYEDLPDSLKRRIEGLYGKHIAGSRYQPVRPATEQSAHYGGQTQAVQPLAWMQPDTGKPILYVSEITHYIVDMNPEESEELLRTLLAHLYRKELLYRHSWRVGDLILWSNRILQHSRTDFDPEEARTLRRCATGVAEKAIPHVFSARVGASS